ncbi:MAG: DNA-binding protein, partial [Planctomycetota bacterium]|nr:DNA-binding protein [Planctomycetota bacterium]
MAIGMSESSLKRWVDRGLLESTRTAGGHRRIRVKEAVRFIRDRQLVVSAPEKLGLSGPVTAAFAERATSPTEDSLYK